MTANGCVVRLAFTMALCLINVPKLSAAGYSVGPSGEGWWFECAAENRVSSISAKDVAGQVWGKKGGVWHVQAGTLEVNQKVDSDTEYLMMTETTRAQMGGPVVLTDKATGAVIRGESATFTNKCERLHNQRRNKRWITVSGTHDRRLGSVRTIVLDDRVLADPLSPDEISEIQLIGEKALVDWRNGNHPQALSRIDGIPLNHLMALPAAALVCWANAQSGILERFGTQMRNWMGPVGVLSECIMNNRFEDTPPIRIGDFEVSRVQDWRAVSLLGLAWLYIEATDWQRSEAWLVRAGSDCAGVRIRIGHGDVLVSDIVARHLAMIHEKNNDPAGSMPFWNTLASSTGRVPVRESWARWVDEDLPGWGNVGRAESLWRMGRIQESQEAFVLAISSYPGQTAGEPDTDNATTVLEHAASFLAKKMPSRDAIRSLAQVADGHPDQWVRGTALFWMGWIQQSRLGDDAAALDLYRRALRVSPAVLSLGESSPADDEITEARTFLKKHGVAVP